MWHHASFKGEELIVLGHDPRRNDCMLVRLSGLPMNEQADLRRVAASRSAQEATYLIPLLRRIESPQGTDWFSYLCKKMEQRNSPVFTLPLKEIQDSLDQDQRAIFKGYGKGRRNSHLDMEDLERAQTGRLDEPVDDLPYMDARRDETPAPAPKPSLDSKLESVIETIADEGRQTRQMMAQLIQAISGNAPAPKKSARPRKTVGGTGNSIGSKKPRRVMAAAEVQTEA